MTVKIVDLFNTKYFYVTIGVDLQYFFSAINGIREAGKVDGYNAGSELISKVYQSVVRGEELVLDLADARVTSDVTPRILQAMRSGIKFVDTKDEERDKLLQISLERVATIIEPIEMPPYDYNTNPVQYIASLQKGVVYNPPTIANHMDVVLSLVVLITIVRPSIQINANLIGKDLLKFISEQLTLDYMNQFDSFYIVTAMGIRICPKDDIYIQKIGKCTLEEACANAAVVPTVFGTKVLKDDPVFAGIMNSCVRTLEQFTETAPIKLRSALLKEETTLCQ